MQIQKCRILLACAWGILLPGVAFANMGTPLVWLSGSMLWGGNLVIGAIEGYVIFNK